MATAISIKNLYKKYNNLKAVNNVSLEIKGGEFFALLGPNGAGKSTIINILSGLTNKSEGEIKIFNFDLDKDHISCKKMIGLVPQEFNMDIFEIVEKFLFFNAGYYGIPRSKRKKRINEVLKLTGLIEKRSMKINTLSGGMKRKLMIARALLHNPKILILDEPTAGVDVETRKQMWDFLTRLNKESKTTFLLTTHYIEEAEQLCDKIAIIQEGKIIASESKKKIWSDFGKKELTITLKGPINRSEINKILKDYNYKFNKNLIQFEISKENTDYQKLLKNISTLPIESITTKKKSLEEIFVDLTNKYPIN